MAKIVFSKKAIDDLEGIKNYITDELLNETAANKTVSKVMEKVHVLEDFPEIGAPLSSIVDIETNHRYLVCGNYIAFYRYEKDTAFIDRILYAKRNFMKILFGITEE